MSVVPCLPAHLCVSPQRPVAGPPTGTRHTEVSSWLRIMAFGIFGLESSEMKHMIHMMTLMGMMDGMTRMTPECPIICSSNHIDDASGLLCPHAKGICRP